MLPLCDYVESRKRLRVVFDYHPVLIEQIKEVTGRKYVVGPDGKGWEVPANLRNAQKLRAIFGRKMQLTERAVKWGNDEIALAVILNGAQGANNAVLKRLPAERPEMAKFIENRPFQKADVLFMSQRSCVNANEPGAGKTFEYLATLVEADILDGFHLIISPVKPMEMVWLPHIQEHLPDMPVFIYHGDDRPRVEREWAKQERGFLITNAYNIRTVPRFMLATRWKSVAIDEYHRLGLGNRKTYFRKALTRMHFDRRYPLSGTPMGGKPRRLFAALNFVDPDNYPAEWRWLEEWIRSEPNKFAKSGKNFTNEIKKGKEEEFAEAHRLWMVRRTSAEIFKDLPEPVYENVWCDLTRTQAAQYKKFAAEAEIKIDELQLSAVNVLAEYMRLKQFSGARMELSENPKTGRVTLIPTFDSGKLPNLLEKLYERGIAPPEDDACWGEQHAIIASQFVPMAEMIHRWLAECGIESALLTGRTKDAKEQIESFTKGKARVICMTTQTGGISLTLEQAESIHMVDETWDPDDTRQLLGRAYARGRNHMVTLYRYLAHGTIEEYVHSINRDKAATNHNVLDASRVLELRDQGALHG